MAASPTTDFDPKDPSDTDAFTFSLTAFLGTDHLIGNVTAAVSPPDMQVLSVMWSGGLVTVWLGPGGTPWTAANKLIYSLSINFSTENESGGSVRGPLKRSKTFIVQAR